jgi:phage tail sheath gpL-like
MPIIIAGFSASTKRPGFFGQTVFGAGPISIGSIPLICLLCGLKSSAGTMTADTDVLSVSDQTTLNTYAGAGSELARMGYAALRVPGVQLKIASPTSGGGVAAVATVTIGGTWTVGGTVGVRVGGKLYTAAVGAGDTTDQVGVALAASINADTTAPVTAADLTSVVTLTVKQVGIRGNEYIVFKDLTAAPTGLTVTLAGGASVTGGGVLFHNGTVSETMTTMLATLFPGRYHRIAIAQNDATSLAAWKTQLNNKAASTEGRMEHAVVSTNIALASLATIATTTLNNERFQACWLLNSESHSSEISAYMAALRTFKEQTDPDSGYDGTVLAGIAPQAAPSDWASSTTQETALGEGVTPLVTNSDGTVSVVRAVTTHSLNGSTPDYRTLDVSQAVVPDYVRDVLNLEWTTSFVIANPKVADNPDTAAGEKPRPAGVATPKSWNDRVAVILSQLEDQTILTETALNPPVSAFDDSGPTPHILTAVAVIATPIQHQIGVQVSALNA